MKEKVNKKYKILFISTDDNYFIKNTPSFYRMYKNLLFFHDHKDYNVVVLQPRRGKNKEDKALKNNIRCNYFREIKFFKNSLIIFTDFNPFFIVQIIKILKKDDIDLIHVDYPYGLNIIRLLTKIPILYNAYNVESFYSKITVKNYQKIPIFLKALYAKFIYILEKRAVKFATSINAISFYDKIFFTRIYKLNENKIYVNLMGINEEISNKSLPQEIAREKLNINKGKFVVIFHGDYFKNIPNREAIEFIKENLVSQVKDEEILFLIAGKMPFFKDKKNLRFLGFVPNLECLLYAADIAIVPIFRGSGVKVKVIDYLTAKIPVILTKQAAKGLFIKNDVHGYILSDKSPIEDIIEKILKLKANPKKLKEFKNNIQKLLENKYNWERILIALERRYRDIIIRNDN